MIELHSARDMRVAYYTNYCIPAERIWNSSISRPFLSLSAWKGRDQTSTHASRDDNEVETLVRYARGTCSKKWRDWMRQFSWPKVFSPRTMDFLNGKADILTDAIRKETFTALFSRYAIKYCILSQQPILVCTQACMQL